MTALERPSPFVTGTSPTGQLFYGIGGDASLVHGCHLLWDATFAGQITVWTSDFPLADSPLQSVVAGQWIQQQPTAGYTPISPVGAATLGASPLIVNVPGGTAGGCDLSFGNLPQRRTRIGVNCSVAGQLRGFEHGKD